MAAPADFPDAVRADLETLCVARRLPFSTSEEGRRACASSVWTSRAFAEVAAFEAGKLTRLGRSTCEHAFAQLRNDDEVVIEATGNAAAVAEVIGRT